MNQFIHFFCFRIAAHGLTADGAMSRWQKPVALDQKGLEAGDKPSKIAP
jgi:hypothetical protein